jgi:hypothetical protein
LYSHLLENLMDRCLDGLEVDNIYRCLVEQEEED